MTIGLCTLELYLPGIASLKEKRSVLKSLLTRIRRQFNVSVAEVSHQDVWQTAGIAIVLVTNSSSHAQKEFHNILQWIETHYSDVIISRQQLEYF